MTVSVAHEHLYMLNHSISPCTQGEITFIDHQQLTLLDMVGRGAFGAVFRGKWTEMKGEILGVKKCTIGGTQRNPDIPREVDILSSVSDHKHIISFHGVGFNYPDMFIVTEFAERISLQISSRRPPRPEYRPEPQLGLTSGTRRGAPPQPRYHPQRSQVSQRPPVQSDGYQALRFRDCTTSQAHYSTDRRGRHVSLDGTRNHGRNRLKNQQKVRFVFVRDGSLRVASSQVTISQDAR